MLFTTILCVLCHLFVAIVDDMCTLYMDCMYKQQLIIYLCLLFVAVLDDAGDVLENIDIIERQKVLMLILFDPLMYAHEPL